MKRLIKASVMRTRKQSGLAGAKTGQFLLPPQYTGQLSDRNRPCSQV